jgi:hypothetical protein
MKVCAKLPVLTPRIWIKANLMTVLVTESEWHWVDAPADLSAGRSCPQTQDMEQDESRSPSGLDGRGGSLSANGGIVYSTPNGHGEATSITRMKRKMMRKCHKPGSYYQGWTHSWVSRFESHTRQQLSWRRFSPLTSLPDKCHELCLKVGHGCFPAYLFQWIAINHGLFTLFKTIQRLKMKQLSQSTNQPSASTESCALLFACLFSPLKLTASEPSAYVGPQSQWVVGVRRGRIF